MADYALRPQGLHPVHGYPLARPQQIDLNNQLVDAVIRRDYDRAASLMQAGASPDNARFDGKNCFVHAKGDRRMENILLNKLDNGDAHHAAA